MLSEIIMISHLCAEFVRRFLTSAHACVHTPKVERGKCATILIKLIDNLCTCQLPTLGAVQARAYEYVHRYVQCKFRVDLIDVGKKCREPMKIICVHMLTVVKKGP